MLCPKKALVGQIAAIGFVPSPLDTALALHFRDYVMLRSRTPSELIVSAQHVGLMNLSCEVLKFCTLH